LYCDGEAEVVEASRSAGARAMLNARLCRAGRCPVRAPPSRPSPPRRPLPAPVFGGGRRQAAPPHASSDPLEIRVLRHQLALTGPVEEDGELHRLPLTLDREHDPLAELRVAHPLALGESALLRLFLRLGVAPEEGGNAA